jgi:CubicO group peptidase (beta-lactamase class C family)
MYILTAEVIRKYWGDHRLFIENEILAPLQMSSTTFSEQKAEGSGHLSWAWDGFANRQIPYWFTEPDIDFLSAAGGIISNVNDMVSHHLSLPTPRFTKAFL